VGVDRDRLFSERVAQDHVRRLEPDARKGRQRLPRSRHLTAVLVDERFRHADDRAGLGAVEARGADLLLQGRDLRARVVAGTGDTS